jgi:hypothetical protein
MLGIYAFLQLEGEEVAIFQHDSAPPHCGNTICVALNIRFPGHWIERGGLVPWSPSLPDLIFLGLFLWGYVSMDLLCRRTLAEHKHWVTAAVATVTPKMLSHPWDKIKFNLDICHVVKGAHAEIF